MSVEYEKYKSGAYYCLRVRENGRRRTKKFYSTEDRESFIRAMQRVERNGLIHSRLMGKLS